MGFLNKTVIITGAANGIGRGIALLYAEKGANVVIADIDSAAGEQTAAGNKRARRQRNFCANGCKAGVRYHPPNGGCQPNIWPYRYSNQ